MLFALNCDKTFQRTNLHDSYIANNCAFSLHKRATNSRALDKHEIKIICKSFSILVPIFFFSHFHFLAITRHTHLVIFSFSTSTKVTQTSSTSHSSSSRPLAPKNINANKAPNKVHAIKPNSHIIGFYRCCLQ